MEPVSCGKTNVDTTEFVNVNVSSNDDVSSAMKSGPQCGVPMVLLIMWENNPYFTN